MALMVSATVTMLERVTVSRGASTSFNGLRDTIDSVALENSILVCCHRLHPVVCHFLGGHLLAIDYS